MAADMALHVVCCPNPNCRHVGFASTVPASLVCWRCGQRATIVRARSVVQRRRGAREPMRSPTRFEAAADVERVATR
jgi:hypothetical protein